MVNKLRAVSLFSGGVVVLLAVWGLFRYPQSMGFLKMAVYGAAVATLPWTIAYTKLVLFQGYWAIKNRQATSTERGSIFVSTGSVLDRSGVLADIESAIDEGMPEGSVSLDQFVEGPGLSVTFAGFHNSFVRIDKKNRVVLTGASKKVKELKNTIESADILSFKQSYINPFVRPMPVSGGFRILLGVAIIGLMIVGVMGVSGTAYPVDAYNPSEKTILMGFDLWADLDPSKSTTESHLDKAAFYVAILEEEAIEISWDNASRASVHAAEAIKTSDDARAELKTARATPLSQPQSERADRIEQEIQAAEKEVAVALEEKMAEDAPSDRGEVLSNASALRDAANKSVSG